MLEFSPILKALSKTFDEKKFFISPFEKETSKQSLPYLYR